jgi:hypothetical protein
MKLKLLLLLSFVSSAGHIYGQDLLPELIRQKVISPYQTFFNLPRERIYVHLNRSEYLAGDNIWFKAYVYEAKTKLPMLQTNKLYAELFDKGGKLIERKTLLVTSGLSNSFFKLNANLERGTYTIRVYTNWMRNFNDQPLFRQDILIQSVASSKETFTASKTEITGPDLQVFPEGGMFVEGIDNHFGVKVTLPDGHGSKVTGHLLGAQNDTLETFTTNHLGFGDFTVHEAKRVNYKVVIKDQNGLKKEIDIPQPVQTGIGMMVNTLFPTKVIIAIKTNQRTAELLQGNAILIMIHNNGVVYKSSYIKVKELAYLSTVSKSLLGPGVNYITIFGPGFKPLAERLIFNSTTAVKGVVSFNQALKGDSLSLDLTTTDPANSLISASLSLSILPVNTTGNSFSNSLNSDLLLGSAIKGEIEAADYYVESNDFQHQKDLDNLLLTQAWRGYKWPEILMDRSPEVKFPFEIGYTVEATAQNLFKGKGEKNSTISLFSPLNNLVLSGEVDDQGKASFNNLILGDSTHVIISAANLKGSGLNRNLKASVQYPQLDSLITFPKISDAKSHAQMELKPLTAGLIELKEVVITGKKENNPFTNNLFYSEFDRVHIITKENYYQYPSVESLLQSKFFLKVTKNQTGDLVIDMGRGVNLGSSNPALIIDGIQMQDLSFLSIMNIQDIEAIAVNKTASSLGLNGGNGSINIITRRTPLDWGDSDYRNTRTIFVKGYAKPAKFFTPKYILAPVSTTYQKYASIYWNADVNTDSSGKANISFPFPRELKEFTIRIEGISQNGTVYHDFKKVSISPGL